MIEKFDVVIQGPCYKSIITKVIDSYRLPCVSKIIVSGWEDDEDFEVPPDVTYVKSLKPSDTGHGNINLQVRSTSEGLKHVTSRLVLKTRADLCLRPEDLLRFSKFYEDSSNKILVGGISTQYAFYTLDFFFFGNIDQIHLLFNGCRYDQSKNYFPEYSKGIIPETQLCAWYISNFEKQVQDFCNKGEDYLRTGSSHYAHSLDLSKLLIESYFATLPCIDMLWLKHYKQYRSMRQILHPRTTDYFSSSW